MNILIIDNGTYHLRALQNRLHGHTILVNKYRGSHSSEVSWSDLIILSGGHVPILKHSRYYKSELDLIKSANKPIIGICLGHELIARAYGTRPTRLFRKVKGTKTIALNPDYGLLGSKLHARVFEAHKYSLNTIPRRFSSLGSSHSGVEVMKHNKLPLFSMQFHPEVISPANDGMLIFDTLLKLAISPT